MAHLCAIINTAVCRVCSKRPRPCGRTRAAAVALVAKQMAEAGQAVLPEALLPDYHRLSRAERERAERLAAEAAAKA